MRVPRIGSPIIPPRFPIEPIPASADRQGLLCSPTSFSSSLHDRKAMGEFIPKPPARDMSPDPFFASRLWLVSLRISIKIPLPRHPKGIRRRQGAFFMSHSTNHPAKKWNPPAQTGAPREENTVASATECTGLTPTERRIWNKRMRSASFAPSIRSDRRRKQARGARHPEKRRGTKSLGLFVLPRLPSCYSSSASLRPISTPIADAIIKPRVQPEESPRQCRPCTLVFRFSSIFTRLE